MEHKLGYRCDYTMSHPYRYYWTSIDWEGPSWYRFQPPAGVVMPEYFPGFWHCGTWGSGWMNGTHPQEMYETKEVTVCYGWIWSGNQCYFSNKISVTNCGNFYVYYLPSVPGCNLRYCGADQITKPIPCRPTTTAKVR